mmetsp:Transcript_26060/g.65685  ORF Transcript_26060/g.65685 Transcript_26060/m.65685 type:complete len:313 (-) Transcript_26060:1526-2464(-)
MCTPSSTGVGAPRTVLAAATGTAAGLFFRAAAAAAAGAAAEAARGGASLLLVIGAAQRCGGRFLTGSPALATTAPFGTAPSTRHWVSSWVVSCSPETPFFSGTAAPRIDVAELFAEQLPSSSGNASARCRFVGPAFAFAFVFLAASGSCTWSPELLRTCRSASATLSTRKPSSCTGGLYVADTPAPTTALPGGSTIVMLLPRCVFGSTPKRRLLPLHFNPFSVNWCHGRCVITSSITHRHIPGTVSSVRKSGIGIFRWTSQWMIPSLPLFRTRTWQSSASLDSRTDPSAARKCSFSNRLSSLRKPYFLYSWE